MVIRYILSDSDDTIARHPRHGDRTTVHAEAGGRILRKYPKVGFSIVTGQPYVATMDVVEALGVKGPHVYEMGWCWGELGETPKTMVNGYPEVSAVRSLKKLLKSEVDVREFAASRGVKARLIVEKKYMLSFAMLGDSTGSYFVERVLPELLAEYGSDVANYIPKLVRVINPGFAVDIVPNSVGKKKAASKLLRGKSVGHGETLALVDSGQEDLEMLELAGYAACPADASEEIRSEILRRKFKGYVSGYTCAEGAFPDILEYAAYTWGFAK